MAHLRPIFTWRSAICESHLPPTQRHVALTLSLHMSERGDSCWPSHETLADETGYHVQTVKAALRELERAGWISKTVRRRGVGRGTRVEYVAEVPTRGVQNTGGYDSTTDIHRCPALPTRGVQDCGPGVSRTPVKNKTGTSQEQGRGQAQFGCSADCPTCEGNHFVRPTEDATYVIPCPERT